ncbi:MAG: hypothetical protein CMK56_01540 [Proteobacteria bacterium]|nr:hypothetical protein [Pseudomonadota bacterium]
MIALTFDIDWASDFILTDLLELLAKSGAKGTFFATHESKIVSDHMVDDHEVGIHPNFNPNFEGKGENYKTIINRLIDLYPKSTGVRFHSLGHNAHCILHCSQKGILYDSSVYYPYQSDSFYDYSGIVRVPFQVSDMQRVIDNNLTIDFENINPSKLYVLAFHPFHIFINTSSMEQVQAAKSSLRNYKKLSTFKTDYNKKGVRYLLEKILQTNNKFITLNDHVNNFRSKISIHNKI